MIIADYSGQWKKLFQNEKFILSKLFGEEIKAIEHIGSTAIPNRKAKPIIDIFAGVETLRNKEYYETMLGKEYKFIEAGMKVRLLFNKKQNTDEEYNIHFLSFDEQFYIRNEILFRDYLRGHPKLVVEYGAIKEELMGKYGLSFDYTYGKTQFIQIVVDRARQEKGLKLQNVWE